MAKFGGAAMTKIGNAAKSVSKSKVVRKTKIAGKKAIKGAKSGVAKFKGAGGLRGAVSKIKPIASDLKQGGVRKINKIVEAKAQNLIPKLTNKIEEKVDSFDPSKFLGKIFDGGLNSLKGFAGGLDSATSSMKESMEFIEKAKGLAIKFVDKLSKGTKKKKKGGGLVKNIFKGLAVAGVAMLAAPTIAKVGLVAGAAKVGKNLLKKGINFFRRKKKEKLEKKKEKDKENKKGSKTDTIFSGILSKLDGVLSFEKSKEETPPAEGKTTSTPVEQSIEPFMLGGLFGKKKKKEPENYQDVLKAGATIEDTGNLGIERFVDITYPREPHKADNKAMGNVRRRVHKQRTQKAYYRGFGDKKHEEILNLPQEDYVNYVLFGLDPATGEKRKAFDRGQAKKRMRGMGAKDRGREGGNFSGEKQKNVRGEYAKGYNPIGGLLGKGKDLFSGLMGGISGMGGKIGSGIGNFLKSDAGNFLTGGLAGKVGTGINLVKGLFKKDDKALEARAEAAGTLAQPVPSESPDLPETTGGGGAADAVLTSGAPGTVATANPQQREMTKPSNVALGLIAVDTRNMHVLHSKSVFNIVDAL